jgi:long-chain acyl-CoA synthetase
VTFLENIFERLKTAGKNPVMGEARNGQIANVSGNDFLALVQQARTFLIERGLKPGERCALIAPNSIRWAALDLAMMAEGLIVVPLYARQATGELVAMMKDASLSRIYCADAAMAAEIQRLWPNGPKTSLLDSAFEKEAGPQMPPRHHEDSDLLTIIYTSGTSGEPKGVILTAGNLNFMLPCTGARLDRLMGKRAEADRIFHYLPFCFAASWILLLTALSRNSVLILSMDLSKLGDDLKVANPNYFLNVPTLLERVRRRIEDTVKQRGGMAAAVFSNAQHAYIRQYKKEADFFDSVWLGIARLLVFKAIRKSLGENLRAVICGSAPLAIETQLFFMMLGVPVLQAYGLTETTGICTLDDPGGRVEPGCVGSAVPGIEMKVAQDGEIVVRGANIFAGYWNRPSETAKALEGGWFHTGDQGEVNGSRNWRITGRVKNLIILNSGHNVAPEPLEHELSVRLTEAQDVMLIGNQRGYLTALVTSNTGNGMDASRVQSVLDEFNRDLPHYKQIRAFHLVSEPFRIENGLLTVNGKLRRDAILSRYANEIEELYQRKSA